MRCTRQAVISVSGWAFDTSSGCQGKNHVHALPGCVLAPRPTCSALPSRSKVLSFIARLPACLFGCLLVFACREFLWHDLLQFSLCQTCNTTFELPVPLSALTPALERLDGLRRLRLGLGLTGPLPSGWAAPDGLLRCGGLHCCCVPRGVCRPVSMAACPWAAASPPQCQAQVGAIGTLGMLQKLCALHAAANWRSWSFPETGSLAHCLRHGGCGWQHGEAPLPLSTGGILLVLMKGPARRSHKEDRAGHWRHWISPSISCVAGFLCPGAPPSQCWK